LECLTKTYKNFGLRGIYKGLSLNIYRDMSAFAIYFASYEWMTRRMAKNCGYANGSRADANLSAHQLLMAGGLAGMFSWLGNYPVDVIKSRYQADGASGEREKYKNIRDCTRKSYAKDGFGVFSRGLCSTLIRAFPTNSVTLFTVAMVFRLYETLKHFQYQSASDREYIYFYAHMMEAGATVLEPLCFLDKKEVQTWRAFSLLSR